MTYEIYTVQINNARAAAMEEVPMVDITVKSGLAAFAPTWDMVWDHKTRRISNDDYTERYLEMMRESQVQWPEVWQQLMQMEKVALGCYCRPGDFCHRHLLKNELMRLHHQNGDSAIDAGELLP